MKKHLISAITIIILFSFSVSAQNNSTTKSKIRIGVLGGINLADIKSNSNQDKKTNIAPAFGLTAEFPIVHGLSVKLEPMYLNKGAKLMEGEDPMEEPEAELKLTYLDLPILLKYSFLERISPYLIAGMEIGYQLNTKLDVMFPGLETTVDMADVTENFEFGVSLGGGLDIPLNSLNLFFDCKYTIGLTNMQQTGTVIADIGGVQIPIDYDKDENGYKNRGLQLLIGITYSIR
jgi:hypothetical protein